MNQSSIDALGAAITALRRHEIGADAFCALWPRQDLLLSALPPRYAEVMEDLLGRLETGSRFSEESCSYSQDDLLAALGDWLGKAAAKLSLSAP